MAGFNGIIFLKPSGVDVSSIRADPINKGLFDSADNLTLHATEFNLDPIIFEPIISRGVAGSNYYAEDIQYHAFEMVTAPAQSQTIFQVLSIFKNDAINNNNGKLIIRDYIHKNEGNITTGDSFTEREGYITLQRGGKTFISQGNFFGLEGVTIRFEEA